MPALLMVEFTVQSFFKLELISSNKVVFFLSNKISYALKSVRYLCQAKRGWKKISDHGLPRRILTLLKWSQGCLSHFGSSLSKGLILDFTDKVGRVTLFSSAKDRTCTTSYRMVNYKVHFHIYMSFFPTSGRSKLLVADNVLTNICKDQWTGREGNALKMVS